MQIINKNGLEDDKKMEGLRLACMYSYKCENAENFGISKILLNFILNPEKSKIDIIKKALKGLSSYKHYQNIAIVNETDFFDINVISFYWKGTPILKTEFWHNYTTLMPISSMPMGYVNSEIIDLCMVHPAEITEIKQNIFVIKYKPIIKTNNKLVVGNIVEKEIENPFMLNYSIGDFVTTHFNIAIEKITTEEFTALENITRQALENFEKNKKEIPQ